MTPEDRARRQLRLDLVRIMRPPMDSDARRQVLGPERPDWNAANECGDCGRQLPADGSGCCSTEREPAPPCDPAEIFEQVPGYLKSWLIWFPSDIDMSATWDGATWTLRASCVLGEARATYTPRDWLGPALPARALAVAIARLVTTSPAAPAQQQSGP